MCGEYGTNSSIYQRLKGSPPRVRGIPIDMIGGDVHVGITPACAGNTLKSLIEPDAKMI